MKRGGKYIIAAMATFCLIISCGVFMEGVPSCTVWWEQFYRFPAHSLKLAAFGSSHCYCSIDPEIFEQEMDGSVVQLSSPALDMVPIEYYIQETFRWQRPEIVVIEAYSFIDREQWIEEKDIQSNRDQAVKGMRWGMSRIKANQAMFGSRAALRKMLPFWDNHGNWENPEYAEIRIKYLFKRYVEKADRYHKDDKFMTEETKRAYEEMEDNPHVWTMGEEQRDAFIRISELCKKYNSRLIVVMMPIYKEWRMHVDYSGRQRQIKELAEEYDAEYLDYNDAEFYDALEIDEKWFRNDNSLNLGNTHLNTYGAEQISGHLAKWILDTEKEK